jgi:hypothetical protein
LIRTIPELYLGVAQSSLMTCVRHGFPELQKQ